VPARNVWLELGPSACLWPKELARRLMQRASRRHALLLARRSPLAGKILGASPGRTGSVVSRLTARRAGTHTAVIGGWDEAVF
jgi:hypothetical protein